MQRRTLATPLTVTFGMHHYWRLGDVIEVIFADPHGRVNFVREDTPRNYFEIEAISYQLNADQVQWRTTYTLRELTTYSAPEPSIPHIARSSTAHGRSGAIVLG